MSALTLKENMQKFGGAMLVAALLFSFSGLLVGITMVLKDLSDPDGFFYKLMVILETGGRMVFKNMPLLFSIGLPIGLAKIAPERAVLATLATFLSFNLFINTILGFWGSSFGVDFTQNAGGVSGLTMIAGIKTLDTSIVGAILIGYIVTRIHNRYFEAVLPDYLGVYQGTCFVYMIGFFTMLPLAFLTCLLWPKVQVGINSMQVFLANTDFIGVWIYTFLERFLIPTGLHHFIYGPFNYGPAIVPNGIGPYWLEHVKEFAESTRPMKELFPEGGFALHGNSKIFGTPGLAYAMYTCAKPENKAATAALLIPTTLTAVIVGVTEPLEFTFLFIAPLLFFVHAVLAASLAATLYICGVVGDMGGGLLWLATSNWAFMAKNHFGMIVTHVAIGFSFMLIYFFVFRFLILKLNIPTPGRGDAVMKLYKKAEWKAREAERKANATDVGKSSSDVLSVHQEKAIAFLAALGGKENIESVNNCVSRLRLVVKDISKVADDEIFKESGAHGVVRNGQSVQVIVGLTVQMVRARFDELLRS